MKQIRGFIGILLLLMIAGAHGAGDDSDLTATLRLVVENHLAGFNREDVAATMKTIHTKSPAYPSMEQALPNQFGGLDARTELLSLHFMGHDDEFAVARVKLKTADQSGAPFAANMLDSITVFHQEDGAWKYWSNLTLGVEVLQ